MRMPHPHPSPPQSAPTRTATPASRQDTGCSASLGAAIARPTSRRGGLAVGLAAGQCHRGFRLRLRCPSISWDTKCLQRRSQRSVTQLCTALPVGAACIRDGAAQAFGVAAVAIANRSHGDCRCCWSKSAGRPVSVGLKSSEAMPQTDESTAPGFWACALLQVGQAPRAEGRRTARSCNSGLWPLALGPWRSALSMASASSP
jgi:hypothetical protein